MSFMELTGAVETVDNLATICERAFDFSPIWAAAYGIFLRGEADRFDAEGPGWAPLKPSTVARKGFATILVETGKMRESLTQAGAEGAVFRPSAANAEMGTAYRSPRQGGQWAAVALASFHQEGTDRMPARPVIDPEDAYSDEFGPLLAGWLLLGEVPGMGAEVPV